MRTTAIRTVVVRTLVIIAAIATTGTGSGPVGASDTPIEITLERTACFGACPVYTVTISGDGTVSYEGREYVGVKGKHSAHIDPVAVRSLVRDLQAIEFFALRDAYRVGENPDGTTTVVTDLPTTFVSLRLGGRFKRVEDYFGGPKALHEVERRIDDVAGTRKWVEVHPTPSPAAGSPRR